MILTQTDFELFDPASGVVTVLGSVANVASAALPVDQGTLPAQIIAGSLTVTPDGKRIYGIGGTTPDTGSGSAVMTFSYNVLSRRVTAAFPFTTSPSLGPRAISVSRDGSYYMTGWALFGCGRDVYCLGTTKGGAPKHPLARGANWSANNQQPILYTDRRASASNRIR